ncbi:MAG: Fe-S protein assembly co-chaperone HscB [Pseudomonadota bacterium]
MSNLNYFSIFNLDVGFDLNLAELEKIYFSKQREFHPDRLVGKSPSERTAAISQSMSVNSAYETLKSPLKRIWHILNLEGIEQDKIKPDNKILIEIMEIREQLADAGDTSELEKISAKNKIAIAQIIGDILLGFAAKDLDLLTKLATRFSYLAKIEEEIIAKIRIISAR